MTCIPYKSLGKRPCPFVRVLACFFQRNTYRFEMGHRCRWGVSARDDEDNEDHGAAASPQHLTLVWAAILYELWLAIQAYKPSPLPVSENLLLPALSSPTTRRSSAI